MARMKILLTEDVPNIGQAGEIYTVAAGYARNYLIPRGEAILATAAAMKKAEDIRKVATHKRAQERANAEAQAEVIRQQRMLFQVRAGEKNRLYGSVTSAEIAEKLQELVGFEVDRRRVLLDTAIRELGIYQVGIRLIADITPTFTVAVVRSGEGWEAAEQRHSKTAPAQASAVETAEEPVEETA
jgi:large subunit ribosomal protein L9